MKFESKFNIGDTVYADVSETMDSSDMREMIIMGIRIYQTLSLSTPPSIRYPVYRFDTKTAFERNVDETDCWVSCNEDDTLLKLERSDWDDARATFLEFVDNEWKLKLKPSHV